MSRIRAFLTSKIVIASLFVLIGGAIYIASLPKSDAVGGQVCAYYSNASYTTVVGARGSGCCGSVINWGVITPYRKCQTLYCTQQVCPN